MIIEFNKKYRTLFEYKMHGDIIKFFADDKNGYECSIFPSIDSVWNITDAVKIPAIDFIKENL